LWALKPDFNSTVSLSLTSLYLTTYNSHLQVKEGSGNGEGKGEGRDHPPMASEFLSHRPRDVLVMLSAKFGLFIY